MMTMMMMHNAVLCCFVLFFRPGMTGDQLYLGHPVHSAPGPVHSNARTLTSGPTMQVVVTMTVPKETKANATAAVNPGGV